MTFVPPKPSSKNTHPCSTCGKPTVSFYFGVCGECMEKAVTEFKRVTKATK